MKNYDHYQPKNSDYYAKQGGYTRISENEDSDDDDETVTEDSGCDNMAAKYST
jgi:hypothetical protein